MESNRSQQPWRQMPLTNKEINVFITRIQPEGCTEKQYLDKLQEKERQTKEIEMLQNNGLECPLYREEEQPKAKLCTCCRCELDWSTGRTFCRFCGGYACGDCQTKKRLMKGQANALGICLACELQFLERMSGQVLNSFMQRYWRRYCVVNGAFTRLADEQNKLQSLLDFEKRKRVSVNGELAPIRQTSIEEKLRQDIQTSTNDVAELTDKIKRAKQVNAKLRETLLSKSQKNQKCRHKRKELTRSISQNPIDEEEELDAPRPQEHESHSVGQQQINESFLGSILEQNIQDDNPDLEKEEFKHRCQCSTM